jgi:hypothetical protein
MNETASQGPSGVMLNHTVGTGRLMNVYAGRIYDLVSWVRAGAEEEYCEGEREPSLFRVPSTNEWLSRGRGDHSNTIRPNYPLSPRGTFIRHASRPPKVTFK